MIRPFKRYNRIVIVGGVLASLLVSVAAMVYGHLPTNFWIFRCSSQYYSSEYYLAYCSDPAFGDYEHGAIYFGNDREAISNLKRADFIFLGNSRAQAAFSAEAIENFFNDQNVGYYNLAFGYDEQDLFPRRLFGRWGLKPRAVIVNADYFFVNYASQLAVSIMSGNSRVKTEYHLKTWIQPYHISICKNGDGLLKRILCSDAWSLFRSRKNGRVLQTKDVDNKVPVKSDVPFPDKLYPRILRAALDFQAFLNRRGACLILTYVPSKNTNPAVAARLAKDIGAAYIDVDPTGLSARDGNHLNRGSVELWAQRFLRDFQPVMKKCLSDGNGLSPETR